MACAPYQNVVLVGFGRHAAKTMLPAIQELVFEDLSIYVVTRKQDQVIPVFRSLTLALEYLMPYRNDTLFILTSPPSVHFEQAALISGAGFDVSIEKPCFLKQTEVRSLMADSSRGKIFELVMYRHSELWEIFRCDVETFDVDTIDCEFIFPQIAKGTFRSEAQPETSLLVDAGIYFIDLLVEIGWTPREIERLETYDGDGDFWFRFLCEEGCLVGRVKIGGEYKNSVTVSFASQHVVYTPFFYGRPGVRTRTIYSQTESINQTEISECNSFGRMVSGLLLNRNEEGELDWGRMLLKTVVLENLIQLYDSSTEKIICGIT